MEGRRPFSGEFLKKGGAFLGAPLKGGDSPFGEDGGVRTQEIGREFVVPRAPL